MTVSPGGVGLDWAQLSPDLVDTLRQSYLGTFRGPRGDAPETDVDAPDTGAIRRLASADAVPASLVAAQFRLAGRRLPGETNVAVAAADAPDGFGLALQVVTDHATALMDSVTVLLHRLGVAYVGIMNPAFEVHRGPGGELLDIRPATPGAEDSTATQETWIHIQLAPTVDRRTVAAAERLIPKVLNDSRQVGFDSAAMTAELLDLAKALDGDDTDRFPGPDRHDVADLLRWLADGHFVLLGYQRCPVHDGQASVDVSSRLGVLRSSGDVLPQLTNSTDLLVLARATIPTYLRFGAYPYIVVVREHPGAMAIEHRFVGLFTVAAMNANVLEIPLIARRVNEALAMPTRTRASPDTCSST